MTISPGDTVFQPKITIALPGFNDLGHSVTPIFHLTDRFLYQFLHLAKNEENLSIGSLNFL